MTFAVDLPNRIHNLPLSRNRPLVPLFEAVMNSIQSIAETRPQPGKIDIRLLRKNDPLLVEDAAPRVPITGFDITDNGVGFTPTNFTSFCTSDSSHKRRIGGKGVGRLTWLKAFTSVEIKSKYRTNGHVSMRRFEFRPSNDGIENHSLTTLTEDETPPETTVTLQNYRDGFKCPAKADTIAYAIIEHFLQFFSVGQCPTITLYDECEENPLVLNRLFLEQVKLEEKIVKLKVREYSMAIRHVRLSSKISKRHALHFCANNLPVMAEDAAHYISNLHGVLADSSDSGSDGFVYAGYVSGKLLDQTADQVRRSFDIPRENSSESDMFTKQDVFWEEIVRLAAKKASAFLREYTDPLKAKKRLKIGEYVRTHPKYRPVFKHRPKWIDELPFPTRDEELDIALYRLNQRYEGELREKGRKLDAKPVKAERLDAHVNKLSRFLEEWNEAGQAKLCEYVVHRCATLSFLKDCLKRQGEGFAFEDVIHDTIFPMRATSDDSEANSTNLWVIDERLCYHYFLASDKEFRAISPISVNGEADRQRADILVFHELERFDNPVAFASSDQPFNSITVIEFKRPNRDDYTLTDNPIDQVEKYVRDIRNGHARDKTGQLIRVNPNTPFYAYIICTISTTLEEIAEQREFSRTPDGGYFRMHSNFGLYEEIIDYVTLLRNASRRNQSFFDKLNMPDR